MENVPQYICKDIYGEFAPFLSGIVYPFYKIIYDGVEYSTNEITNIDYKPSYLKYWEETHPFDPYPWRIPEKNEYYIRGYYAGSGDYLIHEGRMRLTKQLEELKDSVDPAHPLSLEDLQCNEYADSVHCFDHDSICATCDEFDVCERTQRRCTGWESVNDANAEIVLVKTSTDSVPVYAIRLRNPKPLRPVNKKLDLLTKLESVLYDIWFGLKSEDVDDLIAQAGIHTCVSFENISGQMQDILTLVSDSLDEQREIGRRSDDGVRLEG